ncbi:hypothetical protein V6N13_017002 [Hibiscus sabdariffa]
MTPPLFSSMTPPLFSSMTPRLFSSMTPPPVKSDSKSSSLNEFVSKVVSEILNPKQGRSSYPTRSEIRAISQGTDCPKPTVSNPHGKEPILPVEYLLARRKLRNTIRHCFVTRVIFTSRAHSWRSLRTVTVYHLLGPWRCPSTPHALLEYWTRESDLSERIFLHRNLLSSEAFRSPIVTVSCL